MALSARALYPRRPIVPVILLLLASVSLLSQETPTFSSDVKVVNVLATVRDKKGTIVNNLTKDDFKLTQDGQPETIRYFTRETDAPLTLGLLVDTSLSQRRVIEQERSASYAFLNEFMRVDKDKAFIIHFDWEIELLQDLTTDHKKLEAALDKVDMPQFDQAKAGARQGGGTTLYDAIFLASDELMQKQQGRKALILLTDGVDEGSKVRLDRAVEAAQRSNTLVYSILYADPDAYGHQGLRSHGRRRRRHGSAWRRLARRRWRRIPASAASGAGRRQEGSAADLERDRWTVLSSLEEGTHRPDLRSDCRRVAQPVQPGLLT